MTEARSLKSSKSLKFSEKFLSYLEKHRIFELFQELSTMLLIKKPDDHVLFLKQSLCHAARRLDAPRIIILASSEFDKVELADILEKKLNIPIITLNDIIDDAEIMPVLESEVIIEKLRIILMNYMKINCDGWILLNFPRTDKDARCLQRSGIIPTHVIEIISTDTLSKSMENISNTDYYREVQGLRRIFSKSITSVYVEKKKLEDIAEECLDLVKRKNYFHGTTKFRILLIDLLDSLRCKCLGKYIAQIFNVIHIDFHEVLEKICLCDTELGEKIQEAREKTNLNNLPADMKIQAFEHFLLKSECLRKGWVMTGFATAVNDLNSLDLIDTPPNRILVIVSKNYKDSENNIPCTGCANPSKKTHRDTKEKCVPVCDKAISDILKYAGESANIIKECDDLKVMKERIEIILMQPPPCVPPRVPQKLSIVKFEDIEFDPDDEPNIDIFDNIRESEPVLQLL